MNPSESVAGTENQDRPRVLVGISSGAFGGAQSHVLLLIQELANSFEFTLVAGDDGWLVSKARESGVRVVVVPGLHNSGTPVAAIQGLATLVRMLRDIRPGVVHAHSTRAGVLVRLAALIVGTPAVFTVHGWGFTEGVPKKRAAVVQVVERLLARATAKIVTVSDYDRALALRRRVADASKLRRIYNGVADIPFHLPRPPRHTPHLLFVARLAAPKDPVLLLDALSMVKDLKWRLTIVGDGPLRSLVEERRINSGLDSRVELLGYRADVNRLLEEADMFVLPSKYEAFPISILEAMRAGLPVVASNVGGVSEAVVHGKTGILIDRDSLADWVAALRSLIGNAALRVGMGLAGRTVYLERFTAARMTAEVSEVYFCLLQGPQVFRGRHQHESADSWQ